MITTRVFAETLAAYNAGYRIIANKGGTRSSKTFSELQLIKTIQTHSRKPRVITTVSHSFPHLHSGAIRDYEKILETDGLNIDAIRTKNPHIYTINKNIHEFVGFDKPGKALGSARDILFANEANKIPFSIIQQLIMRTTECIFLDWNPSEDFWFDTEEFEKRPDCKVIHSTFYDNIQNLTEGQLQELREAKTKALAEDARGQRGYWWNWWQVYGLGLKGQLEGVIFQNWEKYKELPADVDLYKIWCVDWGGGDPTTFTELNIDADNKNLYIKQHIYQPQIRNSDFINYILKHAAKNELVICDSARKDKIFELQVSGIAAHKCRKYPGVKLDNIDNLQEFAIFVHKDSINAIDEFSKYKWLSDPITGKSLGEPEDGNDHIIDPVGYAIEFYRRMIRPL
jgi:phage terminase large subunit